MDETRQIIPFGGLIATIMAAGYMVVQLHGQVAAPTGDYTNAATVQVRDGQGQIVLEGQFTPAVEEDGDVERRATLAATGVDADATGEAEVEFAKAAPSDQEVEFSVTNLAAGATFTFVIDGTALPVRFNAGTNRILLWRSATAGAVRSRSWPGCRRRPTFTATSARRSSLTGSIEAERLR